MPALFAITLFTSALLLFLVQPMVAKMVQPLVGGGPAVWNTCMVFYQALLLGGYWYAHKLTSLSSQRRQVFIHLGVQAIAIGVMAVAVLITPDQLAVPVLKSLAPRGSVFPFIWVIALLLVAIGVPFFAVSASAPLLQRWFTATGHPSSRDPYFLYAASNAGSLISLLAYPVLVEPHLKVVEQTWLFGGGFALLLAMTILCGRASLNPVRPPTAAGPTAAHAGPAEPPRWRKAKWVALAFVPSSLMLGITTKMTTDVASVPLLWIIPLTLYLLTFIIAYSRMPGWFRLVLANLTPVVTLLLVFVESSGVGLSQFGQAILHIANFFLLSLLMHGELAHDRPDPKHLTNYFLWISFGGVLGGLFNSLLAPLLFTHLYEYDIAIVVGCLLLPAVSASVGRVDEPDARPAPPVPPPADGEPKPDEMKLLSRTFDAVIPITMLAVAGWLVWAGARSSFRRVAAWVGDALSQAFGYCGFTVPVTADTVTQFAVYAPPCMLCFLFIDRPVRFGLCVLAVLGLHHYRESGQPGVQWTERSYFGILRIDRSQDEYQYQYMPQPHFPGLDEKAIRKAADVTYKVKAPLRSLSHGTTLHGKQFVRPFRLPNLRDDVRALGATSGWEALVLAGAPQAWNYSLDPLTYYHRTGPVGDIFREGFRRKPLPRVGMVGLGTGSVAAYATAGQKLTFYEIDRTVRDMIESGDELDPTYLGDLEERRDVLRQEIQRAEAAGQVPSADSQTESSSVEQLLAPPVRGILRNGGKIDAILAEIDAAGVTLTPQGRRSVGYASKSFTFVTDARKRGAEVDIVLGDARLTLEEHKDREYDLLLIDAFSSDSIPTHLLTVEAVGMYRDRLARNGLLALHVSNRYLRLEPVVQAIAEQLDLECRMYADSNDAMPGKTASTWVVLANKKDPAKQEMGLGVAFLDPPVPAGSFRDDGDPRPVTWKPILRHPKIPAWTDDYMDVLRVTRFEELQAVRRWFGLANPVPEWDELMEEQDKNLAKPR